MIRLSPNYPAVIPGAGDRQRTRNPATTPEERSIRQDRTGAVHQFDADPVSNHELC
jgi:hypothetical protein